MRRLSHVLPVRPLGFVAALVLLATGPTFGAAPATRPAAALTPAQRTQLRAISKQLMPYVQQWKATVGDQSVLRDPAQHAALRAKLVPLDRDIGRLIGEHRQVLGPSTRPVDPAELTANVAAADVWRRSVLIAVGDDDAAAEAKAAASSDNKRLSEVGQLELLAAGWLDGPDEAAQLKVLDKMATLLKAMDANDPTIWNSVAWVIDNHGATPAAEQKLRDVILAAYPSKQLAAHLAAMDERKAGADALATAEGRPMTLAGATPDGKPFSTERWKGKVILVDFWASWCGPCKAELPHVKRVYHDYHDKGLEVLAVSNDYTPAALAKYLAGDPTMVWPNLFDPASAADKKWHPLTRQFGINGIPRMFLIDRNGVCRTVEARENMDQMIPKLLAEAVPTAAAN